jgi:hypothetical protein
MEEKGGGFLSCGEREKEQKAPAPSVYVREFKGIEEEKLAGFALDTKNPQVYKPGGSVFSSIRARHDLWTCCGRGLLVSVICEVLLLLP